jgi:hypothetical protein
MVRAGFACGAGKDVVKNELIAGNESESFIEKDEDTQFLHGLLQSLRIPFSFRQSKLGLLKSSSKTESIFFSRSSIAAA